MISDHHSPTQSERVRVGRVQLHTGALEGQMASQVTVFFKCNSFKCNSFLNFVCSLIKISEKEIS